jgi:pyruvate dehydrogenase E2 component (dihydrolipoamide acetyltransferase)
MRKVIARRLAASKREIPHYYLTIHCNIDALMALRARPQRPFAGEGEGAYKLSVNDFVVRAVAWRCAVSGRQFVVDRRGDPHFRHRRRLRRRGDAGNGLITPVVRNADQKGLADDLQRDQGARDRRATAS